uniref:Uncharacterized protein n=1 Tax=Siphoviridae sp. ctTaQ5 TaxID=2827877 RepID=A0A8S5SR75_9CAUD|nr:MAG TPA: hypothetical protein [Siphoviridae sp. ctTaQ5]
MSLSPPTHSQTSGVAVLNAWKTTRQSQSIFDSRKQDVSNESRNCYPSRWTCWTGYQQARPHHSDRRWYRWLYRHHGSRL